MRFYIQTSLAERSMVYGKPRVYVKVEVQPLDIVHDEEDAELELEELVVAVDVVEDHFHSYWAALLAMHLIL